MIANYHTHTTRCHHAVGSEEEYIESAIAGGMKILGFADHTPQVYPAGYCGSIRMLPDQLQDYTDTLCLLRMKYEGKIQLHIGLEAEYYPALFQDLMALLKDTPVEYLILGQHWCGNEIGETYLGRPFDDPDILKRYANQVLEALDSGVFTYVAHPDLVNFKGDPKHYERYMRQLCRGAAQRRIPLEINLGGMRNGSHYPNPAFWRIAAEEECRVVLGCDAHSPQQLNEPLVEKKTLEFADQFDLYPQKTVALRPIG